MSLAELSRTGRLANDKMANDKMALETAAVTRLLVAQGILDYSDHVSTRIHGKDAIIIPTEPDPSHIKTPEQGRALARTLAHHHAALMRAHGLVLVAESTQALFIDAVLFKENATAQMQSLQVGAWPLPLTDAEIEHIEK